MALVTFSPLPQYRYEQLSKEDHIRILTLLPGRTDDPINCQVIQTARNDASETYEAISYCWGDPKATVDITCNGQRLSVTLNLRDALRALRHTTEPKRLWTDAIYINQSDHVEKSHQVRSMGKVYRDAKAVRVWLGPDEKGIARDCFELIKTTVDDFTAQLEEYERNHPIRDDWNPAPAVSLPADPSRYLNLMQMVELPWFSRVWTVQEVALACTCTMLWGEHELDIAELLELCYWFCLRVELTAQTTDWGCNMLMNLYDDFYATYGVVNSGQRANQRFGTK